MFSAIIFDCDGVLVNSESIHVALELEHLAELGLVYERGDYIHRMKGRSWPDFLAALSNDHEAAFATKLPDSFSTRLSNAVWAAFEEQLSAMAGVAELLNGLSQPRAVASSSGHRALRSKLEMTGLISYFDPHVVSSDHVEKAKPAPDIFLHAAEGLNVPPRSCLVIEDSVNGVLGARAAGMTVWGYTGDAPGEEALPERLRNAGASEIFAHHDEIRERLG
ncbi:HAD family hydrolase [Nisaea sediminum]|uniref:HAD family hydrolase n=1 Tax=Nisaea sediminum TaxID=2775867 RepID=UPI0018667650|nr:HAD family phosphatase [Nisaea sediminum]